MVVNVHKSYRNYEFFAFPLNLLTYFHKAIFNPQSNKKNSGGLLPAKCITSYYLLIHENWNKTKISVHGENKDLMFSHFD